MPVRCLQYQVHVFGRKWDLLPKDYEAVWFGQSLFSSCLIV